MLRDQASDNDAKGRIHRKIKSNISFVLCLRARAFDGFIRMQAKILSFKGEIYQ